MNIMYLVFSENPNDLDLSVEEYNDITWYENNSTLYIEDGDFVVVHELDVGSEKYIFPVSKLSMSKYTEDDMIVYKIEYKTAYVLLKLDDIAFRVELFEDGNLIFGEYYLANKFYVVEFEEEIDEVSEEFNAVIIKQEEAALKHIFSWLEYIQEGIRENLQLEDK